MGTNSKYKMQLLDISNIFLGEREKREVERDWYRSLSSVSRGEAKKSYQRTFSIEVKPQKYKNKAYISFSL